MSEDIKHTSEQWNKILGGYVVDPDGWPRSDPERFKFEWYQHKIDKTEFMRRAFFSTCRGLGTNVKSQEVEPNSEAADGSESR
jgi:hypothetical protein